MRAVKTLSMVPRIALALVAVAAVACAGSDVSSPQSDPLASLTRVQAKDSASKPADTTSSASVPSGPGYFQGLFIGYTPGPGADTLASAVRLSGATVSVYRQGSDGRATGDVLASTTTDASGRWQTATLSGGTYVVTFVPASGSDYQGAWTIGYASPASGTAAWWIVVQHK